MSKRHVIGFLRRQEHPAIAWGFVSQAFSSGTNFGLSLLAGRMLGPTGLGHLFLGFAAYLVALGTLRGLLIEPFVATSAAESDEVRHETGSHALSASIVLGVLAVLGLAALGIIVGGAVGRSFLIFTPWLVPALIQQTWRSILFRDRRASAAAANDGIWFLAMALAVPFAWWVGTDWALVGAWGVGATAGMLLGFAQTRLRPRGLLSTWSWWRSDTLPFGKWNAGTVLVGSLGTSSVTFTVAAILGASALGGLRAAQTIFAPLTLILPAIAMPGLPAVARALRHGFREARALALGLSAIAVVAAIVYVAFLLLGGWRLLPFLFGSSFAGYRDLIWPTAGWQASLAAGVGLTILLKAGRRGPALLVSRAAGTSLTVLFVAVLAWRDGLIGAAWGAAAGAFATSLIVAWASLRRSSRPDSILRPIPASGSLRRPDPPT